MGKAKQIDIDKEWLRVLPQIAKVKGGVCIYCGEPATEYHHIVPRHMGGDNRLSNIVPLCYECHQKAHSKRSNKKHRDYGRKPKEVPNNFDEVADAYLDNRITRTEALEMTSLKKSTFYRMLEGYRERTSDKRKHGNGRISNTKGIDNVIDTYLSELITYGEALEITMLKRRGFNKRLYEYRQRTGDMRIPKDIGDGNGR